jgi:site-specific recombinase XerD
MKALARSEAKALVLPDAGPPLDQRPAAVYLARLGNSSRRVMGQALDEMAGLLAGVNALQLHWGAVRYQHTTALRARLIEQNAPATANRKLSALRGVLREAWRLGQMSAEDYQQAASIEGVRNEALPAGRALDAGEIKSLMLACDNPRDAAIIALLYGAGLRRAEIVGLNLKDYNREKAELKIRGKGGKERLAHLSNGAFDALADWLEERGDKPGPLFLPITKSGEIQHRAMTSQAIYNLLRRLGEAAGIAAFSPHDLRRSFIGDLLDAGADLATVAHMAGHSQVQTTARYDRRGEAAKRKAAAMLHVPYVRRTA